MKKKKIIIKKKSSFIVIYVWDFFPSIELFTNNLNKKISSIWEWCCLQALVFSLQNNFSFSLLTIQCCHWHWTWRYFCSILQLHTFLPHLFALKSIHFFFSRSRFFFFRYEILPPNVQFSIVAHKQLLRHYTVDQSLCARCWRKCVRNRTTDSPRDTPFSVAVFT